MCKPHTYRYIHNICACFFSIRMFSLYFLPKDLTARHQGPNQALLAGWSFSDVVRYAALLGLAAEVLENEATTRCENGCQILVQWWNSWYLLVINGWCCLLVVSFGTYHCLIRWVLLLYWNLTGSCSFKIKPPVSIQDSHIHTRRVFHFRLSLSHRSGKYVTVVVSKQLFRATVILQELGIAGSFKGYHTWDLEYNQTWVWSVFAGMWFL